MDVFSMKANPLNLSESDRLFSDSSIVIPGGTQTFSKMPYQHVAGVSPKLLFRGSGCRSWDVDGNEYIDLSLIHI